MSDDLASRLSRLSLEVSDTAEKHKIKEACPNVKLYCVLKPEDFKIDGDNRIYAMKINDASAGMVRFKVSKASTVYFAAVHIKFRPSLDKSFSSILHCGLVVKNDFEVTQNGSTETVSNGYLVAHAMFVRPEYSTKLVIALCPTRDDAFNQLALVAKNADHYNRVMSPGFVSRTPCSELVEKLQAEIRKPFDKHWAKRLTGDVEKLAEGATNCAIFAGGIFYALAPTSDEEEIAIKGMLKLFEAMQIPMDKVKPYISALKK